MASDVSPGDRLYNSLVIEHDSVKEMLLEAIKTGTKDDVKNVLGSVSQPNLVSQEILDIALETACNIRNISIMELLLVWGASVKTCISAVVENITSPENSVASEDMDILKLLLQKNNKSQSWDYEMHLIKAVKSGDYNLTRLLCEHGADPSGVNLSEILLIKVASKGRCDFIDLLISFGVVVNPNQTSHRALCKALKHGHTDCMKMLIKHGANIDPIDAIETAILGNTLETLKLFPELYKAAFQNVEYVNQFLLEASKAKDAERLKFFLQSGMSTLSMVKSTDELLMATENTEILQLLIDNGVGVHETIEMCNYLRDIIERGMFDIVKIFLDSGFDINSDNFTGDHCRSPLVAAETAEMVQLLIDKGACVNDMSFCKCCGKNYLPLLQALHKEDEVLKVLLENGADREVIDENGHSALMMASQIPHGNVKVEMLLKAGACVNRQTECGKTALILAVGKSYTNETVKLLLQYGADVNLQSSNETALLKAISRQNFKVIKMLFKKGINTPNVNTPNEKGDTPLSLALKLLEGRRSVKLVNLLIIAGADLNRPNSDGYTALMIASQIPYGYRIVEILLKAGACVNRQTESGITALILAADNHITNRSVKLLLQYGADVNLQSIDETALLNATSNWNFKVAKMLLEKGINTRNVNTSNKKGDTPLLLALELFGRRKSDELVKLLISAGADVNRPNSDGYPALMLAAESGDYLAIQFLTEAGANVNAHYNSKYPRKTTAMSFLFKNDIENPETQLCIEELLNHGAKTSIGSDSFIQKLIEAGGSWLVPKIIQNGCLPQDHNGESPLCAAFKMGNEDVARYLLGNKFLTKSDISFKFKSILRDWPWFERSSCKGLLQELTSQPFSLVTLCFFEVSTALGTGPDREERVKKTGLPNLIQTKLLFETENVLLSVDEQDQKHLLEEYPTEIYSSDDDESDESDKKWCNSGSSSCDSSGDDLVF